MLSRLNEETSGTPLPEDFLDETQNVLEQVFKNHLSREELSFFFYGEQFANEVYFVATIAPKSGSTSPHSFFISIDKPKKENQKAFSKMLDSLGYLIEKYFEAGHEWDETFDLWTQAEVGGHSFYYKVNRENVQLTLEANKLLTSEEN